jgi:peptidoglycan/xylan/chitin deacetylase (PgdA/CDA1 family)
MNVARRLAENAAALLPAGVTRRFGRPMAFFFHGVEPRIDDPRIQFNHHTRERFYGIARALGSRFDVLPLTALPDVLAHPERHARAAFLMADDGYRNLAGDAADILDGLGLPWTLFVSTHHIDSGELVPFTTVRLFCFFAAAGRHDVPHLGTLVLSDEKTRAKIAAATVAKLRRLDMHEALAAVRAMRDGLSPDTRVLLDSRFGSEKFLNWPEVAALAKRGVEIGAHAHWHWPMHGKRSAAELETEARTARQRIETQVGPCRYFAYPFGRTADLSRNAVRAVENAGFTHAFTTLAGTLDGGCSPFLLPRYGLPAHIARPDALPAMMRFANIRLSRVSQRFG